MPTCILRSGSSSVLHGRNVVDTTVSIAGGKRRSRVMEVAVRLVKEKPLGLVGAIVTLLLLVVAIFAPYIAPYGMNETGVTEFLAAPSLAHPLGGDQIGRDILTRLIYGARTSVIVSLSATLFSVVNTVAIGLFSGYFGGKFDLIVQRFVDAWECLPHLPVTILVMSLVGGGMPALIISLGVLGGIGGSRVIRGLTLATKEDVYVQAAQALGAPTRKILWRHILPNIMATIIVLFTTRVPGMMLSEASLSFLGYGVPPPAPSWGGMLSHEGLRYIYMRPAMAIWPGLALSTVVFGVNMFGDALRDLLDPRLRGGLGRYGSGALKKAIKRQPRKATSAE